MDTPDAPSVSAPSVTSQSITVEFFDGGHEGRLLCISNTDAQVPDVITLYVVDVSGSMSGEPKKQVDAAIKYIADTTKKTPEIIIYDTSARKINSLQELTNYNCNSMTSFRCAFEKIAEYLIDLKKKNFKGTLSVVFMTDGQDNSSGNLKEAKQTFVFKLNNCGFSTVVHSLGFSNKHDKNFLEDLKRSGSMEGVYRYAEGSNLENKFSELFDFIDTVSTVAYTIDGKEYTVQADIIPDKGKFRLEAKIWLEKPFDPSKGLVVGTKSYPVALGDTENPIYRLELADRKEIRNLEDINAVQKMINDTVAKIPSFNFTKGRKTELYGIASGIQDKIDEFRKILADDIRSANDAKLADLRYAAKFSKNRHQRAMDIRATKNNGLQQRIMQELSSQVIDVEKLKDLSDDFICEYSHATLEEILKNPDNLEDCLGVGLYVERTEATIDAPAMLIIKTFGPTIVSLDAVHDSIKFKLSRNVDHSTVHGGFYKTISQAFMGRARESINAFFPFYVCEEHWQRVKITLPNLLGFLYTLDPLGYAENQVAALMAVLGNAVAQLDGNNCERSKLILDQITLVCSHLLPEIMDIRKKAGYNPNMLHAFLTDPKERSKTSVVNIMSIVGWLHLYKQGCFSMNINIGMTDIYKIIQEECWRRFYNNELRGQDFQINLNKIKSLIYTEESKSSTSKSSKKARKQEIEDKEWADFAKSKSGHTKKTAPMPSFNYVELDDSKVIWNTCPAVAVKTQIMEIFQNLISKTKYTMNAVGIILEKMGVPKDDLVLGCFSGKIPMEDKFLEEIRAMIVQSLHFCHNDSFTEATENGHFFDCREKSDYVIDIVHQKFEKERTLNDSSKLSNRKADEVAKRLCNVKDIWTFAGILMGCCPHRGGLVFPKLINYMTNPEAFIPLLYEKTSILFLGKIYAGEEVKYTVFSEGEIWISVSDELVEKFINVLTLEKFLEIEFKMKGFVAKHVYRNSDKPNRHTHCNSNPSYDPRINFEFKGFKKR